MMNSLVISLVLATSPSPQPLEASIAEALDDLDSYWQAGRFHDAATAAGTALALIEQSACPLRGDAALAAFMGGVAGTTHTHMDTPTGYMFWVAIQVHAQLDTLPDSASAVAEALQSPPGRSVLTDPFFHQTPYLDTDLPRGCGESRLSQDVLTGNPAEADHLFIAFGFPRRATTRPARPERVVYAYPHDEGLRLGQRIIEDGEWYESGDRTRVRVFTPCSGYLTRDLLQVEVCRDRSIPHPDIERTDPLGEGGGQG